MNHRHTTTALACAIILTVSVRFASAQESLKEAVLRYVDTGDEYMRQDKPAEALEAYKNAEDLEPGFTGLHARLGALYTILKDYDKAIEEIEAAIQLDPTLELEALPQLILTCVYRDNPKAIKHLARLTELDPQMGKKFSFQVFLARMYGLMETQDGFEIGQPVSPVPDSQDAAFLPGFMETAALHLSAGENEKAVQLHKETLLKEGLSPHLAATINHSLGMIYAKKLKQPDQALEHLEKASSLWPENNEFSINLIDTYRLLGKYPEAATQLKRMLSSDPDNKYALFFMGSTWMKLQDWDKAVECWDTLARVDPILFGLVRNEYDAAKIRRK